jgi:hypothetical protein
MWTLAISSITQDLLPPVPRTKLSDTLTLPTNNRSNPAQQNQWSTWLAQNHRRL